MGAASLAVSCVSASNVAAGGRVSEPEPELLPLLLLLLLLDEEEAPSVLGGCVASATAARSGRTCMRSPTASPPVSHCSMHAASYASPAVMAPYNVGLEECLLRSGISKHGSYRH